MDERTIELKVRTKAEDRKNAVGHLATGAALVGAGEGGNYALGQHLKRMKAKGGESTPKAILHRRVKPVHLGRTAAKVATRVSTGVGIPLAAYGAWNAVNPEEEVRPVNLRRDVLEPAGRKAVYRNEAEQVAAKVKERVQSGRVDKRLSPGDSERLQRHKTLGRDLSLAGGTIGATALALRAPEAARGLLKVKGIRRSKKLAALANKEGGATKASNTLLAVGAGLGSAGAFNYAAQQKLENKALRDDVEKAGFIDPPGFFSNHVARGARAGYRRPNMGHLDAADRAVGTARAGFVPPARWKVDSKGSVERVGRELPPLDYNLSAIVNEAPKTLGRNNAKARVRRMKRKDVSKRDDRFLRDNRNRISTKAEAGYEYLRSGRNDARLEAALGGAGALAGLTGSALSMRRGRAGIPLAVLSGVAGVGSGVGGAEQARKARTWEAKMAKIRAKAHERAELDEYGHDREVGKADEPDKKKLAAAAAAGGTAVALAPVPYRLRSAPDVNERLNASNGMADVDDVRRVVRGNPRGTGRRASEKVYQARMTDKISREGFEGMDPIRLGRSTDGSFIVEDGHHRHAAAEASGTKKVPVTIRDTGKKAPLAWSPLYRVRRDKARLARERTPRPPQDMDEVRRTASKPIPRHHEAINRAVSNADAAGANVRDMASTSVKRHGKTGAVAAAAGLTSAALTATALKRKEPVEKALFPVRPSHLRLRTPKMYLPKPAGSSVRTTAPRVGHLRRLPGGSQITVRGTTR